MASSAPARTRIKGKTWFLIVLLALMGQVAWAVENNFFNLFIQDVFGASLSDVALMVSASALTATVLRSPLIRAGNMRSPLLWASRILTCALIRSC